MLVPMVVEQFTNLNAELPILTTIVIALSEFIQAWGLAVLIAIIGVYFLFRKLIKIKAYRFTWHRTQLHLPVITNTLPTTQAEPTPLRLSV